MSLDILADTHVHTSLCRHASGTMEEYVVAAIEKGLKRLVFLEHLEEGINAPFRSWLTEEDFDYYFAEGSRLKNIYGKQIQIGLGVEVGYNPDCAETIQSRLQRRNWERIGLSCHFFTVGGHDMHLNVLSKNQKSIDIIMNYGADRLLTRYFDTLIEAVATIPANVLCHLDAGLRHQPDLKLGKSHWNQIETLLDAVKDQEMALEINTSGYKYRGQPFPLTGIIDMARHRSINFSVGSDAHSPAEIGRYFDQAAGLFD
ncbi:MAG: histidinol-phosphatase [Desulfofustis sp.]